MIRQTLKHILNNKIAWVCLSLIALFSIFISNLKPFLVLNLSPLIISVLLGILITNSFKNAAQNLKNSGALAISTKQFLRFGIILFGFRLNLNSINELGFNAILLTFLAVFSTFFIAIIIGRFLGLDKQLSALIGSGTAICGAAAVMASSSTIKSHEQDIATAICTVVLFGTIGMFIYPIIFKLDLLNFNTLQMGIFTGSSLHEVAHVIAAGSAISEDAKAAAVVVKMLRVLMLVPFLIMLAFMFRKNTKDQINTFPYFALYFFVAVCINSIFTLPEFLLNALNHIGVFFLSIAMGALGFTLNKNTFKNMSFKPFLLAIILFLWIFLLSFLYVKFIF